jgi:hypothetical protein
MVALFLVYMIIAGVAASRGYRSPLFGASGVAGALILSALVSLPFPHLSDGVRDLGAAFVSTFAHCALVLDLPRKNPRASPKTSSVPYGLLGVGCLLLAFIVLGSWVLLMARGIDQYRMLPRVALVLVGLALVFFLFRKQQRQLPGNVILEKDLRPPVLFLRSFKSDSAGSLSLARLLVPTQPGWMGKSFEQFLAPEMSQFGPFVALGNPDDYLPALGAAKVYQEDERWRETIFGLLPKAAITLLMEGDTAGLRWELKQVRQRCAPQSVFVVTPNRRFRRTGWGSFRALLEEAGFDVPKVLATGAVVGFDAGWHPSVLCEEAYEAKQYAEAIKSWVDPSSPTKVGPATEPPALTISSPNEPGIPPSRTNRGH